MASTSYEEHVTQLTVTAVKGLPEIRPGDDLATLIRDAARAGRQDIREGDIVVIAQKIVSKSEGRIVHLSDVVPGERARAMAAEAGKAGAAELVMGKLDRCPVAIVRGFTPDEPAETAQEYVRPAERDLFR